MGWAAIIATWAAPIAATIAATTKSGNASVTARYVAIVACIMELALFHLACFCWISAFCFSSSLFLSAVLCSAALFLASPSSVEITPLFTRFSMRSFSSSPASSFFSCCSSIFSICRSYMPITIVDSPSDIAAALDKRSSIPNLPSFTIFRISSVIPPNSVPSPSTASSLTFFSLSIDD